MTQRRRDPNQRGSPSRPSEDTWLTAARELAANPDSPRSLRLMSAFDAALRPRVAAVQQLVEALALRIEQPGAHAEAAVQAALAHWQSATESVADDALLDRLRQDAAALVERRRSQPPPLASIIAGVETTDVGYDHGLHMQGLHGTWHRLWASIAMGHLYGSSPVQAACVADVRAQLEALLGRPLSSDEWEALDRHARAHASTVARR